jgi:photosystem II stability/assembly factor-like uncharacterized protein
MCLMRHCNVKSWAKVFVVLVLAVTLLGCSSAPKTFKTDGRKVSAPQGCIDLRERGLPC